MEQIEGVDDVPFASLIPMQNDLLRNGEIVKRTRLSDDYEVLNPGGHNTLGQGVSGPVIALKNKTTGLIVAMKQIKVSDATAREVTLHYISQKECKYITKIHDIYINRCRNCEYFYLLMEHCAGGELFDAITGENNRHFNERQVASVVRQITEALKHLHLDLGIAHRDLKPENVLLLSRDQTIEPEIRLTDFGFAKQAKDPKNQNALRTACYTPYYAAPEVFGTEKYDVACDIWSLGVIVYIMLTGEPPFYSIHGKNAMTPNMKAKVLKGQFKTQGPKWDRLSPEARDLIPQMLEVHREKRIKIKDVIDHVYLTLDLQKIPEVVVDYQNVNPEDLKDVNRDMTNTLLGMRVDEEINLTEQSADQLMANKLAQQQDKKNKFKGKGLGGKKGLKNKSNLPPLADVNTAGDASNRESRPIGDASASGFQDQSGAGDTQQTMMNERQDQEESNDQRNNDESMET